MIKQPRKKQLTPKQKALERYIVFMVSLVFMLGVFGVVFPDLIQLMGTKGYHGGDAAAFLLTLGNAIRTKLYIGLAPAVLGTIIWLSPLNREAVFRILYVAAVLMGLALIAGGVALYLDLLG